MRKLLLPLGLIAAVAVVPSVGQAQSEGQIDVIQPRPFLRQNRLDIAPRFGMTINDPMLQQYSVGGALTFSFSEQVFVQATFDQFDLGNGFGGLTQGYEDVIVNALAVPEIVPVNWSGSIEVGYAPIYGKVVAFNRILGYYDIYFGLGGGLIDTQTAESMHPAVALLTGIHLYVNDFLSLNFEIRDRLSITEELPSGDKIWQTVTFNLGLGLYIPFGFNYDERGE